LTPWFDYPTFDCSEKHAVVIGAGIAGCQMTWHLSQLGWRVTLVEQAGNISSQASGNLAGVISPKLTAQASESEQFYTDAFTYTTEQLKQLISLGAAIDWHACGLLQLAHNDRELKRWNALKARDFAENFIQLLDKESTAEIAGIACDYPASYFPKAGFINPASFCQALLANSHYQLIQSTEVTQLRRDTNKQHWEIIGDEQAVIASAETVVICNGQNLNQFSQTHSIPLGNVLGQTSLAKSSTPHKLKCVIGHEGYLTPTYDGVNVFGATYERDYAEISLSTDADQHNFSQLKQYLPEWAEMIVSYESGHAAVRPATPDRYPFAGAVPETSQYIKDYTDLKHGRASQRFPKATYHHGLFLLGGLGSRGLTTSGYCAHLLSQLMNNQLTIEQGELLNKLHPARFLIRQIKRGEL